MQSCKNFVSFIRTSASKLIPEESASHLPRT
jgi:hypothetical protein